MIERPSLRVFFMLLAVLPAPGLATLGLATLGLVGGILASPVRAADGSADFSACAAELAEQDLENKLAYQRSLRDLVVAEAPQYEALADISRDLQVAFAKGRKRRLMDLTERDPARLQGSDDIMAFRNFNWSDEEETALRKADPDYDRLQVEAELLRTKNDGHEDWPALRDVFQNKIAKSPDFAALMGKFQSDQREMEQAFRNCRDGKD